MLVLAFPRRCIRGANALIEPFVLGDSAQLEAIPTETERAVRASNQTRRRNQGCSHSRHFDGASLRLHDEGMGLDAQVALTVVIKDVEASENVPRGTVKRWATTR